MYEKLLTRRSIRKYQDRQVEEELLDKVLQAGLYAPQPRITRSRGWWQSGTRPPGTSCPG